MKLSLHTQTLMYKVVLDFELGRVIFNELYTKNIRFVKQPIFPEKKQNKNKTKKRLLRISMKIHKGNRKSKKLNRM